MKRIDTSFFHSHILKKKTKPVSVEREKELALIIQAEAQTTEALKKLVRRSRNKLSEEEKSRLVDFIDKNPVVREAICELVMANLGFAIYVASEYLYRGIPADDLRSLALEGLIIAAFRYKPDMGTKFISYAVWWARQVILEALEYHKIVRPPLQKIGESTALARCDEQLTQVLGRYPTQEEVQKELKLSAERYAELRAIQQQYYSLDAPVYGDDKEEVCWGDLVVNGGPSPDKNIEEEETHNLLDKILKEILTDREQEVLKLYFGLNGDQNYTLEEIGDQIGLTRERVRQIKEKALKKFRSTLGYEKYRKIRRELKNAFPEIKSLETV